MNLKVGRKYIIKDVDKPVFCASLVGTQLTYLEQGHHPIVGVPTLIFETEGGARQYMPDVYTLVDVLGRSRDDIPYDHRTEYYLKEATKLELL